MMNPKKWNSAKGLRIGKRSNLRLYDTSKTYTLSKKTSFAEAWTNSS